MSKVGRAAFAAGMGIVDERLLKHGRALGFEALARLVQKTPVDTGHARGNWFVGIGSPVRKVIDGRMEGMAMGEGQATAGRWDSTKDPLHLTNTVPYIERLEDGWSQQAPAGMAKLTVLELRAISDRIAVGLNRG